MSDMTYSIHLFTKGEGNLKTTQDLFAKATDFLQQGIILYAIIKDFTNSIPNGHLKDEVMQLLEKLPLHCQQLKNKLKMVVNGKTATFNKARAMQFTCAFSLFFSFPGRRSNPGNARFNGSSCKISLKLFSLFIQGK